MEYKNLAEKVNSYTPAYTMHIRQAGKCPIRLE